MARQDSGKLARFAAIFSTTRKMASEIENFGDVEEALGLGYIAFGAGGFFGEKRRAFTEFSLAAKITKATSIAPDGEVRVGFAAKLGDCSENATGMQSPCAHAPHPPCTLHPAPMRPIHPASPPLQIRLLPVKRPCTSLFSTDTRARLSRDQVAGPSTTQTRRCLLSSS